MAHTSNTAAKPAGNSLDHPGFWRFFVNVYLNAALLGEGDEIVRSYSEADLRKSSGSLAIFAAILRASSRVSNLVR
jgi:hypothetical protein